MPHLNRDLVLFARRQFLELGHSGKWADFWRKLVCSKQFPRLQLHNWLQPKQQPPPNEKNKKIKTTAIALDSVVSSAYSDGGVYSHAHQVRPGDAGFAFVHRGPAIGQGEQSVHEESTEANLAVVDVVGEGVVLQDAVQAAFFRCHLLEYGRNECDEDIFAGMLRAAGEVWDDFVGQYWKNTQKYRPGKS